MSLIFRFFFILHCSVFAQENRANLQRLDEIMRKAKSVEGFVNSPAIQDEYYHALVEYMGSEKYMPREAFNTIVTDLRDHLHEVRGLGDRLWETTDLGQRFTIEQSMSSLGRQVGPKWDDFFARHKREIQRKANAFLQNGEINKEKMARYAARINRAVVVQQKKVVDLNDQIARAELLKDFKLKRELTKARGTLQGDFQKKLGASPLFQAYAAAVSHHHLGQEYIADVFGVRDPDVLVDNIRKLRQYPSRVFADLPAELQIPTAASEVRKFVPEMEALLGEKQYQKLLLETRAKLNQELSLEGLADGPLRAQIARREAVLKKAIRMFNEGPGRLFPIHIKVDAQGRLFLPSRIEKQSIVFEPLPRRIHGIWKGIKDAECVGGSCAHLTSTSIERWATVALDKTQFHAVEAEGVYKGFTQVVPVKVKGKLYGSVDWGASILANSSLIEGFDGKRPLVEVAIQKLNAQRPPGTLGLIMGESRAVGNSGVLESAWASSGYKAGEWVGAASDMSHADWDMAHAIVGRPRKRNVGKYSYDGNMAFDAAVSDAGQFRRLLTIEEIAAQKATALKHILDQIPPSDGQTLYWLKSDILSDAERVKLAELVAVKGDQHPKSLLYITKSLKPPKAVDKDSPTRRLDGTLAMVKGLLGKKEDLLPYLGHAISNLSSESALAVATRLAEIGSKSTAGMILEAETFSRLHESQRAGLIKLFVQGSDSSGPADSFVAAKATKMIKLVPEADRLNLVQSILDGRNLSAIRQVAKDINDLNLGESRRAILEKILQMPHGLATQIPEQTLEYYRGRFEFDYARMESWGILDGKVRDLFNPKEKPKFSDTYTPFMEEVMDEFKDPILKKQKLAAARLLARYANTLPETEIKTLLQLNDLTVDKYLLPFGKLAGFPEAEARRAQVISAYLKDQISFRPEELESLVLRHSAQLGEKELTEILRKGEQNRILNRGSFKEFLASAGDMHERHWPALLSRVLPLSPEEKKWYVNHIAIAHSYTNNHRTAEALLSSKDPQIAFEIANEISDFAPQHRNRVASLAIQVGGRPVAERLGIYIHNLGRNRTDVLQQILDFGIRDDRLSNLRSYSDEELPQVVKILLGSGHTPFRDAIANQWNNYSEGAKNGMLNALDEPARIGLKLRLNGICS